MTTAQQLVVGIFQDQTQAELAVDELVRAGFEQHQIDFAEPRPAASTGGILEQIKNLFTGQDASPDWLYQDLMRMGVPPEEILYYQREFEAGHSIVAIHGTVGMQMASLIMTRNGGHGPNKSATQSANSDQGTGAQQPAQEDIHSNQGTGTQQPAQEDVHSDQGTGTQQPTQEDVHPNQGTGTQQSTQEDVHPNQGTGTQQSTQEDINDDMNMEPHRSTL